MWPSALLSACVTYSHGICFICAEIKTFIHQGRIQAAIDSVNAKFPGVLISSIRNGAAPPAPTPSGSTNKSAPGRPSLPSYPTSLDPAHLELNLLIQQFIETVRNAGAPGHTADEAPGPGAGPSNSASGPSALDPIPGPVPPSSLPSSHPLASPLRSAGSRYGSRAGSPAPSSAASSDSALSLTPSGHIGPGTRHTNPAPKSATAAAKAKSNAYEQALEFIQNVHASCNLLPDARARVRYLKEIENVSVLLAYPDPAKSAAQGYLDHRRRMALAEQVNAAILLRTGHASQPLLESVVRQTSFLLGQLAKEQTVISADEYFPPSPLRHDTLPYASSSIPTQEPAPWWTHVAGAPFVLEKPIHRTDSRLLPASQPPGARITDSWSLERFLESRPLKQL